MAKSKTKSYQTSDIESARKYLLGMPAPEKSTFSASEVVADLAETIKVKLAEGHTLQSIAEGLNAAGIDIKPSRFRSLWSKVNPSRRKRTKKTTFQVSESKPEAPDSKG